MVLVDTHTHLYLPHFTNDIEQVIQNAADNHVVKMLLPNIDCATVDPMLQLCNRFPVHCHPMLGLHPTSVRDDFREQMARLQSIGTGVKITAIGETGMDAYWGTDFIIQQEDAFIMHLDWAKKTGLPVVIHSRQIMDTILSILKAHAGKGLRGVLHAFSGTVAQATEAISIGFKLGIGGVVTYKNSGLGPVIESVGLENILLETDSPYLTPIPKRGSRNESANLLYVARKIAEIKGVPVEEVACITTRNAAELFNLDIR
jgi:TatD DNase family protein